MIKRKFGWTNVDVPIIGQGTWLIDNDDIDNRAIETLKIGLDLGMTRIDTAEMYGNGKAEELVGQAVVGTKREDIFLVSTFSLQMPLLKVQ